jgi:hypothetical protein
MPTAFIWVPEVKGSVVPGGGHLGKIGIQNDRIEFLRRVRIKLKGRSVTSIEIRRPEHPLPLKRSGVRQVHRVTEESRELGDTIREKESAGMKCGVAGSGLTSDTLEHRGRKLRYIGILGE